ncbi:UPF0236 family transposase-like protein, partial [[Mycoplasma] collis]|uniref:UPF0236 family transposase-like protein n=1 Tax=[Mycoplasma] collis TaxID=2127 RepID=UPI00051B7D7B
MYKAANWEKFNDKKYLQELKENIINEDNKYFNSEERKNEKWQVKDFRNRKIKTKYGLLEVRIRYYFKPEKNKIIYSFCPYLNFVKYQRFSNNLAIEVI